MPVLLVENCSCIFYLSAFLGGQSKNRSRSKHKDVLNVDIAGAHIHLTYIPVGKKKPVQDSERVFWIKRLAIPYFHMATCHTIIGAKRFHYRVRDGIGWFTLAMFTKQTVLVGF